MLHIQVLCVGKIKEKYLKDAIDEYSKRLSKYCNLSISQLNDEPISNNISDKNIDTIKNIEGNNILSHIKKDSYIIALDLKGKQISSTEFSSKLESIAVNTSSNITFIIGGSLGLSEDILKRSNELLCFSKMTFTHQLIRVFLLEQIFRAFKISNNENYHK